MSKYAVLVGLLISLAMSSCKIDRICPAYQSYYLLDENTQTNTFAYIDEENAPRRDLPNTKKDENGLVKSEWYVVKDWNMRTIPMQVVYPVIDDSLAFLGDEMMYAETDIIDSVSLDSARAAALGFRYTNDQRFYNWYFKEKLVWKDEQLNKQNQTNAPSIATGTDEAKKPFFQRIFKSKEEKAQKKADKQALKDQEALEPKPEKVKKEKKVKPEKKPKSDTEEEEEGDEGFGLFPKRD